MKALTSLSLLFLFLMLGSQTGARAQTNSADNPVVFPELRSATNSVLMTNAEFRCTVGSKLFFQSGDDEHGFEGESLDTNVLATLGLTLDGLKDAQARMDAKKHMAAAQYQQWLAARAQQQQQAAAAQAAADATDAGANNGTNANSGATSPKPAKKHAKHGLVAGG